MLVPMKIEVGQILESLSRPDRRYFTRANEAAKPLCDFDVDQVRGVEFSLVSKKPRFDSDAKWCLQEHLQQGGRVEHDHAVSRASRMTTAAGVFKDTRLRLCNLANMSCRVGRAARRSSSARR